MECEQNNTANEDGKGSAVGRPRCTVCLKNTVLFDGKCYACPLADVARMTIKQEEEKQSEMKHRKKKHASCN